MPKKISTQLICSVLFLLTMQTSAGTTRALLESESPAFDVVMVSWYDPEIEGYSRRRYENALIRMLLEKTRATDGDYVVRQVNFSSNSARELRIMRGSVNRGFVRTFAVDADIVKDKELVYIKFPFMRGALSYRICLSSEKTKKSLDKVDSFEEFRRFSHVQGLGWLDLKILDNAGLNVVSAGSYTNIPKMVARNRVDLYCRGIGEVQSVWNRAVSKGQNLVVDDKFLLYYPMPRYLFTHRLDKKILDRIEKGLDIALRDGSFIKLWERFHMKGISASNLASRKVFVLENPFIGELYSESEKYFYAIPDEAENIAGNIRYCSP